MSRYAAALLFALLLLPLAAPAQETPVTLDQIHHPALLLKTSQPGVFLKAPTVKTEISLRVRGIVARGLVKQQFENPTSRCVEAVYVFPLSEAATVDAMRMRVGQRTISGEIKERLEAQRVYEQAKSEGRKASLLEQHRGNVFTVSVASMAAGESAEIEIEYQEIVSYDERFSLRVPLAIGPRYTPVGSAANGTFPQTQYKLPLQKPQPVTLEIDLDAGIPLATVLSPTHELDTIPISANRVTLKPKNISIAADRDFELVWTPRLGTLTKTAAFTEVAGDQRYTLLMLFPPDVTLKPAVILPRETIFVIDTSGSMGGPSIESAKQALLNAVRRLRPSDHFNVIEFNSYARALFTDSRRADRDAVAEALRWVESLESTGGTEMMSALKLALNGENDPGRIRQVVFVTDGQVGNEAEIFELIRGQLGGTRLFTIGIGHAPNSYFMRNAARAGRGTFTHIGDIGEVEQRMTEMFRKLESPVLSNIELQLQRGAEAWPQHVPDLYAGQPLVVTVKGPVAQTAVGKVAATGWSTDIAAPAEETATGIAKLWARQKIDAVRDTVFTGANAEDVRKEIVALGLAHHLVTEHTSLVAVDTTPAGVDPQSCKTELVPIDLPAGWGGGIDGALPQTATNAPLLLLLGAALLLAAAIVWKS